MEQSMKGDKTPSESARQNVDIVNQLSQRLYASYSESKLLIPSELLSGVKNSLEPVDRRADLRRRVKLKKERLSVDMSKLSARLGRGMATTGVMPPMNMTAVEVPEISRIGKYGATTSRPPFEKIVSGLQNRDRAFSNTRTLGNRSGLMTPARLRAEAERELEKSHTLVQQPSRYLKDRARLKPIRAYRDNIHREEPPIVTHIEIIRLIEDGKSEDQMGYHYCKKGKDFYEFNKVAFSEITPSHDDYIIISDHGVTHFVSKEAEFMSLTEWTDEVENYQKINKIKFFQNFRIGKSFSNWKKFVKRTKMVERGAFLSKELYHADIHINQQLIKIRQLLHTLVDSDILQLGHETSGIEKLSSAIIEKQEKLRVSLSHVEQGIKSLIKQACKNKTQEFNKNTRVFGKEETKKDQNKEDLPYHIFADDSYHPMPYTVAASTKTLNKRLARCIKTVDYMLMDLKLKIIKNSYLNLLSCLTAPVLSLKRVVPIFNVKARFKNGKLNFYPDVDEVKTVINKRLSDGIKMIYTRPMIADDQFFEVYMSTLENEEEKDEGRTNPLKTIEQTDEIMHRKQQISDVLEAAFDQLETFSKQMEPFIKIYNDHSSRDFDKLEGQEDTIYRTWVDEFEYDKKNIYENLEETIIMGIIKIDASELKKELLKKPEQSRSIMEKLIPIHSKVIVDKLMNIMKEIEDGIISGKMVEIDDYVEFKKFIEKHRSQSEEYDEQLKKAKSLHQIMQDSRMELSNTYKKELSSLETKWKNVNEKLKQTYEKCESMEASQKSVLLGKVPKMKEKLKSEIEELDKELFYQATTSPNTIVDKLLQIKENISTYSKLCEKIIDNETYLQIPKDDFDELSILTDKHNHLFKFWKEQKLWQEKKEEWLQTQIKLVDVEEMKKIISYMSDICKESEIALTEKYEKNFEIAKEFQEKQLDPILSSILVIQNILKDTVEERHWKEISTSIGCTYNRGDAELKLGTLQTLLESGKAKWKAEGKNEGKLTAWIKSISEQAEHENQLGKSFDKVRNKWETQHLVIIQPFANQLFMQNADILLLNLNECMKTLQKILENEYAEPLREKAELLYKNIAKVEEILEEMIIFENKMKFVEELLSKEEFKSINLGTKYDDVVKQWKKYVKRPVVGDNARDSLSQRFIAPEGREQTDHLSNFQDLNKKMDDINSEIELKIEEKQIENPRLLFISSQEYVRMMHECQKMDFISNIMGKCFGSIKELLTVNEGDDVYPIGVISKEGEQLRAATHSKLKIGDSLDKVFSGLEDILRKELKSKIKNYYNEYMTEKKTRSELMLSTLCQAALVGEALIFTSNTEVVIEEEEDYDENMEIYFQEQCIAYADAGKALTSYLPSSKEDPSGGHASLSCPPDNIKTLTLSALIVKFMHNRDVVDFLLQNEVKGINNFYWQTQLRYYMNVDTTIIKQMEAVMEYGYEYLGVRVPSPISSTTSRCWLSITNALRNKYFSTIVGPADHGIEETVKDLADCLGKFHFEYVCTPQTNAKVLEKLLIGAVASFSWVLITKANELSYGPLSSFANQIMALKKELIEEKTEWTISSNRVVPIVPKFTAPGNNSLYCNMILSVDHTTINKLTVPYLIKTLFRPCSITSVDFSFLGEAFLYMIGFKESSSLGIRLGLFFKTCHELVNLNVSDFGYRSMRSLCQMAGEMKSIHPELIQESQLVFLAIKLYYSLKVPKDVLVELMKVAKMIFAPNDIKKETLPIVEIPSSCIESAVNKLHLQFDCNINEKINELNTALARSRSCILLGDAVCGKSTLIQLLQESLSIYRKCEPGLIANLNPKSYSLSKLFGGLDGKDWVEGILTHQLRKMSNQNTSTLNILVLDGPLDPIWPEQLQHSDGVNLSNGAFVFFDSNFRIIYEGDKLSNAAPATISHCPILFLPQDTVMPRNIIQRWLQGLENKIKTNELINEFLKSQIDSLMYGGLAERQKIPKLKEERIRLSDNEITLSFCNIFESLYSKLEAEIDLKKDKAEENLKKLVGKCVVFALAWSYGGSLTTTKLKKIDDFVEEQVSVGDKPKETSCFEAMVRVKNNLAEFVPWNELADPFEYSPAQAFTQIVVPTNHFLKYRSLIDTLATANKSVLIIGDTGSGKSLISRHVLREDQVPPEKTKFKKINLCFTWETTPNKVYKLLEERLYKVRKNLYSAPIRKTALIYIDDINLPKQDSFGTVQALETMRGILEHSGYYDTNRYFWKKITNTSFLCAANFPNGGRKEIPERFRRHFLVFSINTTGYVDTRQLYDTVLTGYIGTFAREYGLVKTSILDGMLDLHETISQHFTGNPRNPHYQLSVKDISKVFSGLLLGKPENLKSPEQLTHLLIHEAIKVYEDRLVTSDEKQIFRKEVDKVLEKNMSSKWKITEIPELIFSSIASGEADQYTAASSLEEIEQVLENAQKQSNSEADSLSKNNLVFFKEAIEYCVKVGRILSIPRACLMNIGPQSLGRKSLVDITTYLYDIDFIIVENNMRNFETAYQQRMLQLSECLEKAESGESKGVCIFYKVGNSFEAQPEKDIPKIQVEYEKNSDKIMGDLYQIISTEELSHLGKEINSHSGREYMSIILTIPNDTEDLRRKMKMYPALFSEFHIVYQQRWPVESFVGIAKSQIIGESFADSKDEIASAIVKMHRVVEEEAKANWKIECRKILVGQNHSKEIARLFTEIYEEKAMNLEKLQTEVSKAIEIIEKAEKLEIEFQEETAQLKLENEKIKSQTDAAFSKRQSLEMEISNLRKEIVEEEEKGGKLSRKVPADKVTDSFEKAKQEFAQFKTTMKGLEWKQINGLSEPPNPLALQIIELLWQLTKEKKTSWEIMQKGMKKTKTDAIIGYDINFLSDFEFFEAKVIFEDLQPAVEAYTEGFPAVVEKIYNWEKALLKLIEEIRSCLSSTSEIEQKKDNLLTTMLQFSKQNKEYENIKSQKDKMSKQKNSFESKCFILNELRNQLLSESSEWKGISEYKLRLEDILNQRECLLGDCLFVAGILTYLGPFGQNSRSKIKDSWKTILLEHKTKFSKNINVGKLVGSPQLLMEWHQRNLLKDEVCIENAFIMHYSNKWPIFLDPEEAVPKWLGGKKKIIASNPQSFDDLMKGMVNGIEVLFDGVPEQLDGDIIQFFELPRKRKENLKAKFGENRPIEVSKNFMVYMRCEHNNPIFPDEIYQSANIINFSLTSEAIQSLLAVEYGNVMESIDIVDYILEKEDSVYREEEEKNSQLLSQVSQVELTRIDEEDQRALKDKIYDTMKTLTELRKAIHEKKMESKRELSEKVNLIKPIFATSAVIYRCASYLTELNPTYLFTFNFFKRRFVQAVKTVKENDSINSTQKSLSIGQLKEHSRKLMLAANRSIFNGIFQSMFYSDFLQFTFICALKLAVEKQEITEEEYSVLLYGVQFANPIASLNKEKIPDTQWAIIGYLEQVVPEIYQGLSEDINKYYPEYEEWLNNTKDILSKPSPGLFQKKSINSIRKLILIKCLAPEKLLEFREPCTAGIFGDWYLNLTQPSIQEIFKTECKVNKPLLIIKDERQDPTQIVMKIGGEESKIGVVTLCQETEQDIRKMIDVLKKKTDKPEYLWLFIREIHSFPEFSKYLAEKIKEFTTPDMDLNDAFRIIISCNPCRLTRGLLINSCRIALEGPTSMRQKIINDLQFIDKQSTLPSQSPVAKEKPIPEFRRLALGLSMLHAIIEKRNIFGTKAWLRPFNLTPGDIDLSSRLISYSMEALRETASVFPWGAFQNTLETICLGGKIIEQFDHRTLGALISIFFNEDVSKGRYTPEPSSVYSIPEYQTFDEMIEHVKTFPIHDDFQVCMMDKETARKAQIEELDTLFWKFTPGKYNHIPNEEINHSEINEILDKILNVLPDTLLIEVHPSLNETLKGLIHPHNLFILKEKDRYNCLIELIQDTIIRLKNCLSAGEFLSPENLKMYYDLLNGVVPQIFLPYPISTETSQPLGQWLQTLGLRIEYIKTYLKTGSVKAHWLAGYIYPKGLFNSYLLHYSRSQKKSLEQVNWKGTITPYTSFEDIKKVNPFSLYLRGLTLFQASFNSEIESLEISSTPFTPLPLICFTPSIDIRDTEKTYECPIFYLPIKRETIGKFSNQIQTINIPTELPAHYLTLKGVVISATKPF